MLSDSRQQCASLVLKWKVIIVLRKLETPILLEKLSIRGIRSTACSYINVVHVNVMCVLFL